MKIYVAILLTGLLWCCKSKPTQPEAAPTADTTKFFEVAGYIESQIREVNSTPYYIYKLTTEGAKKDSSAITSAETAELAKQFTNPDLNDKSSKKFYKESVFFDETTKNFSVNYSTTNKELVLQNEEISRQVSVVWNAKDKDL
jgi:hypothetical protein